MTDSPTSSEGTGGHLVPFDSLPQGQRRLLLAKATLSTLARVALVILIYFIVPMDRPMDAATIAELVLGALAVLGIIAVQIWRISRADYPTIRAVEALAFTVPLFVLLFATTYYLMDHANVASFGVHLTRVDAMYFSSTVFTTVGFGDIAAKSQAARVLATAQMWLDVGPAGGRILIFACEFVISTLFWWWTLYVLLYRRIGWRELFPAALATAVCLTGLGVVSALVFSNSIVSDDKSYGPVGAIMVLLSWCIGFGVVVHLGAVVGRMWNERIEPAFVN
jgi:voltage-gated potassium channel